MRLSILSFIVFCFFFFFTILEVLKNCSCRPRESYVMPEIEYRLAACKANPLPLVLLAVIPVLSFPPYNFKSSQLASQISVLKLQISFSYEKILIYYFFHQRVYYSLFVILTIQHCSTYCSMTFLAFSLFFFLLLLFYYQFCLL